MILAFLFGCAVEAQVAHPGLIAVQNADCAMCHRVPIVAQPERDDSCVSCHQWVKDVAANPAARKEALALFPRWERYERNVKTYFAVPDLGAAFARFRYGWIRNYLMDPYDLRPAMDETMVRLGLSYEQIDDIASWADTFRVDVPETPRPEPANVPLGRELFVERGCSGCHAFGAELPGPGIPAAPDLRHTRQRMHPDMVLAWIADPHKISAEASMPSLGLVPSEVLILRDYVMLADPKGAPAPALRAPPAAATRGVTYDEVEEKVFGKICIHCHMDPAQNEGRAGPGNDGGFGWPSTGIELQTYESVVSHGPAIVDALERRREEAARDYVRPGQIPAQLRRPERPGMPLGLPPIPDEDIALVKAWYAAGAPR